MSKAPIAKPARRKKRPKDWAIKAAEAIWWDLNDRRGFGLKDLQYTDWPMYIQIIRKHASLIRNAAQAAGASETEGRGD